MVLVKKPEFISELEPVDISGIRKIVESLGEKVWNKEDARKENDFECFHDTRHIVFRFIEGMRDHRCYYSNPIWEVWKDRLLPVLNEVVGPYNFRRPVFPKVMLARLRAGAGIDRHHDGAGSNLHTHKIHIPILTNEKTLMFIKGREFHLAAGRSYEVNNIVPHAVQNSGDEDRIHLIFEVFEGDLAG